MAILYGRSGDRNKFMVVIGITRSDMNTRSGGGGNSSYCRCIYYIHSIMYLSCKNYS